MKKMTKWLAVCAVCVMGSVPAMAAEVPDVTVTPIPIETPAPDVTPIETPAPTPIPEVKNGWYEYGTKNKKYFKDGQYLTGMRKIHGEVYYFSPKGFMKTGWIKYNNKKYYFDSNGIRYSGVKKISGKYYYFSDKGVLRTKTVKVGNTIYYCTEKGILEAWKKGKTIYYPNGKKMNSTKAYEYETLQRAKDVVSKITKPSMSKSEKFETCFRWVMYQHYYDTRRIFYNQTAWPALYANDYLILSGKGGDCFSDACSFAYLAKALGYKNVYVCVDTTATDGSGHCWAEIGGRVYDPLFAEAKSYYGYFGVGYGSYGLYPQSHKYSFNFQNHSDDIDNNGIVHNSAPLFFQNICNIAKALLRSYYDNGISDLNGILASGNLDLTISVQVTYKEVFLQVQFR